jgi:hypothetical protein
MTSIYQEALGSDFEKLHPMVQRRFGFATDDHIASIGRGVMEKLWLGRFYTIPFLYLGSWRNIMFPEAGENVPFTIENYAYRDSFGRETVTWIRTFDFGDHKRRFDATMIHSEQRGKIVDFMGTHQHLAVDIDLAVAPNGGLRLFGRAQRFYEGPIAFGFPMFFSGIADVCEWYDDNEGRYRIEVVVQNRTWGRLFGYSGWFDAEFFAVEAGAVPAHVKPLREERRE